MRKLYYVLALVLVVLFCSAAGLMWKRVPLTQSGVISVPATWRVLETDSAVTENAYGPGVSCRTLLTAESPVLSAVILMYWPYGGDMPGKFVMDMAESLKKRSGLSSTTRLSEIKIGSLLLSSVTYPVGGGNSQKVTAFIRDGKIYSFITNYKAQDEYNVLRDLRGIMSRWKF